MQSHFGCFFVQLSGKGTVQNHFITMAHCPLTGVFATPVLFRQKR